MRAAGFPVLDFADGVDESVLARLVPNVDEMAACLQDPVFHAEGDVWTHTVMVARALAADPDFLALPRGRREALSWAALLHDVEKPSTRMVEHDPQLGRDRVRHPHHAAKGARRAWGHLWRLGAPLDLRRAVHALVAAHQKVFHVLSRATWEEDIIRHSLQGPWRDLVILAQADNRGRVSPNAGETHEALVLVRMAAEEKGCLDAAWGFPSPQAMVRFARARDASPFYDPPPPQGSRLVVLSGLPGSGKNSYAERGLAELPQVSFDAIRLRMGVRHGDSEGQVAQAGFEEARGHLRAGRDFVWNATSLTRLARDRIVDLALAYDARVEIHAVEAPYRTVMDRNERRAGQMLPREAIERYVDKWDAPLVGEAHAVVDVDGALRPGPAAGPSRA